MGNRYWNVRNDDALKCFFDSAKPLTTTAKSILLYPLRVPSWVLIYENKELDRAGQGLTATQRMFPPISRFIIN